MEQVTDTEKRRAKTAPQMEPTEEYSIDWLGLGLTVGSWVLQGAALAAGGALMTKSLKAFSSQDSLPNNRMDDEVIPLRKNIGA